MTGWETMQADDGPGGAGVTQTPACGLPGVGLSVGVQVEGLMQDGEPLMTQAVGEGNGVGMQLPRQLDVVQSG